MTTTTATISTTSWGLTVPYNSGHLNWSSCKAFQLDFQPDQTKSGPEAGSGRVSKHDAPAIHQETGAGNDGPDKARSELGQRTIHLETRSETRRQREGLLSQPATGQEEPTSNIEEADDEASSGS